MNRSRPFARGLALTLACAALATSACQPPLEQAWQLTDFRVIGVRVDPPEPSRGADVQVSLAWADVQPRPVQVVWILCTIPISSGGLATGGDGGTDASADGGGAGGLSGCSVVTQRGAPVPIPDFGTTVTVHIPETGGSMDASDHEVVTLVGFACAGGSIGLPTNGSTNPTCRGGTNPRGWQFTRSIRIHDPNSPDPPNQNPHITEVRFGPDGGVVPITDASVPVISVCANQEQNSDCPHFFFEVGYSADSREVIHALDPNDGGVVVRPERLTTGYMITHGTLGGAFRTDSAEFPNSAMQNTYRAPAAAGDIHVVIFGTDGRGGFDWTDRFLRAQ